MHEKSTGLKWNGIMFKGIRVISITGTVGQRVPKDVKETILKGLRSFYTLRILLIAFLHFSKHLTLKLLAMLPFGDEEVFHVERASLADSLGVTGRR